MIPTSKTCPKCQTNKPASAYHTRYSGTALSSYCRECQKRIAHAKAKRHNAQSLKEAFKQHAPIGSDDTCWLWTKSLYTNGYGRVAFRYKEHLVHRVAWELAFGPIPNGLLVLHRCDVRNCVNPAHLFLGTAKENTHDAVAKGRINAKLTKAQVRDIYLAARSGTSRRSLATKYGVTVKTISDIAHGRQRRDVTKSL